MNAEITHFTYLKGELVRKRFSDIVISILFVVGFILFILPTFFTHSDIFSKLIGTKVGGWLMLVPMIIIGLAMALLYKILFPILFLFYKTFFKIKEETVAFAIDKIITSKSIIILNNDNHKLKEVKIVSEKKKKTLEFSFVEKNKNGTERLTYKTYPVADFDLMNANKVVAAFEKTTELIIE